MHSLAFEVKHVCLRGIPIKSRAVVICRLRFTSNARDECERGTSVILSFATQSHEKSSASSKKCLPCVCVVLKRIRVFYAHARGMKTTLRVYITRTHSRARREAQPTVLSIALHFERPWMRACERETSEILRSSRKTTEDKA